MFEKIEEIIEKTLVLQNFGWVIIDRLSELYCINSFSFVVHEIDVGRVHVNPLSPYSRFGLNFQEAVEFSEMFGFIIGAVSNGLGRCVSEIEMVHIDKVLDKALKEKTESLLKVSLDDIRKIQNGDEKSEEDR